MNGQSPRFRLSHPTWWCFALPVMLVGAAVYIAAVANAIWLWWWAGILAIVGIVVFAFGLMFMFNHEDEGTYRCVHCGERVPLRTKTCPKCDKTLV